MESEMIETMIQCYTKAIETGNFSMPTSCCRCCHEKADHYTLHECRKRTLRIVIQDIVEIVMTFLLRWKCPLCQCTFTDYPVFMIPHKRFALFDMCRFGQKYLESETASYRNTVKSNASDIGYIDPGTGLCEQFLSHSTLYCFMGYLSNLCPSFHENMFTISSNKYRTSARKFTLTCALYAIKDIAKKAIFPDFETLTA